MARVVTCPNSVLRVHVHADDGRVVCAGSKDAAHGAIRNGVSLGIISQAEAAQLQQAINTNLSLPADAPFQRCLGGVSHTFVRGILDTLDVMCGSELVHPDDEQ